MAYYHISHSTAEIQSSLSGPLNMSQTMLIKSLEKKGGNLFTKDLGMKKKKDPNKVSTVKAWAKESKSDEKSISWWLSND